MAKLEHRRHRPNSQRRRQQLPRFVALNSEPSVDVSLVHSLDLLSHASVVAEALSIVYPYSPLPHNHDQLKKPTEGDPLRASGTSHISCQYWSLINPSPGALGNGALCVSPAEA